jgi:ABC-type multidrug transport system ATPase subunit
MKAAGKCIILTTHFLEEADVLSDQIAIMTSGRLQANGTPDFLKNQIGIFQFETIHISLINFCHSLDVEFEYRLFIDKQEAYPSEDITAFIQNYIPTIVLERESSSEMVFGIRRSESKQIAQLIHALDKQSPNIGVESYGLSMTTIEEVFLKLEFESDSLRKRNICFVSD